MSASRKGLKRYGMRAYLVDGDRGSMVIRRLGSRNFTVRHLRYDDVPWHFFGMRFPRLRDAVIFAREECCT